MTIRGKKGVWSQHLTFIFKEKCWGFVIKDQVIFIRILYTLLRR